jgi:hypothetical protein
MYFWCNACSGAIMVVLNNLLMRFKSDLKLKTTDDNWTKRCGELHLGRGKSPRPDTLKQTEQSQTKIILRTGRP